MGMCSSNRNPCDQKCGNVSTVHSCYFGTSAIRIIEILSYRNSLRLSLQLSSFAQSPGIHNTAVASFCVHVDQYESKLQLLILVLGLGSFLVVNLLVVNLQSLATQRWPK